MGLVCILCTSVGGMYILVEIGKSSLDFALEDRLDIYERKKL